MYTFLCCTYPRVTLFELLDQDELNTMIKRSFSSLRSLQHENPLVNFCNILENFMANIHLCQGLPRSGVPPTLPRRQRGLPEKRSIQDVRKVIVVSSAKGGVGKSTIAGEDEYILLLALAQESSKQLISPSLSPDKAIAVVSSTPISSAHLFPHS